ncbi:MAG: Gldg family protein, partial [Bacteroidota bacterium]
KRYSLSEVSKATADSLQFPLEVAVYMEGDFPPNVRALQDALRTTLIELEQYAGRNLEYEFIEPDQTLEQEFVARRFSPLEVNVKVSSTERKAQRVWPLVRLKYGERETFVDLLKGSGMTPSFQKAEADLEYKLISGIRKISGKRAGIVMFLEGHKEKSIDFLPELRIALESNGYQLARFNMKNPHEGKIPLLADVVIVIQPEEAFTEREKFELDQYLLSGGSVLWIMDNEIVDLNIFEGRSGTSQLRSLNLDDMFFQYGFKINYDLIMDLSCATEEFFEEEDGRGKFRSEKWVLFPQAFEFPQHPISRNVDLAIARNAASIDTLPVQGNIKRSVFYQSSPRSKRMPGQQFINVVYYTQELVPESFNQGPQIMGLLSEGEYTSVFRGRDIPFDSISGKQDANVLIEQNNPLDPGKIVVISDGDFVSPKKYRGQIQTQDGRAYPMPPDNKILVMNAVDYLAGDIALSRIRSKEVIARILDGKKVEANPSLLQILNIGLPLLLLFIYGLVRFYLRKQRNAKLAID